MEELCFAIQFPLGCLPADLVQPPLRPERGYGMKQGERVAQLRPREGLVSRTTKQLWHL